MASWTSNGSTDRTLVTVTDPSHAAPVADRVVTPHVGVDFLGLSPGIISAVYVSPLAIVKSDLFIVRAVCSRYVFVAGAIIVFSLIVS